MSERKMEDVEPVIAGNQNTIQVGYDFGNGFVQVSFCRRDTEPETISPFAGTDRYQIPAVLCRARDSGRWLVGEEAGKAAARGEGILVENLLENCRKPACMIEIDGESYDPRRLLGLFLKKTFKLVKKLSGADGIEAVMFTMKKLDGELIGILRGMADQLEPDRPALYVQDYKESFYSYMLGQPSELRAQDVVLFEPEDMKMKAYHFQTNHRTVPKIITISESCYDWPGDPTVLDQEFTKIIGLEFNKKVVSAVYLIGGDFDKTVMKKSMDLLCMGRRVFGGRNLYTKGACYAAQRKVAQSGAIQAAPFLYLGEHRIRSNIAVEVLVRGERQQELLIEGGKDWYDAAAECEFILDGTREIRLQMIPLSGGNTGEQVLSLGDLPKRPDKTTRMRMRLYFSSPGELKVQVEDLGFGSMFPGTGKKWKYSVPV